MDDKGVEHRFIYHAPVGDQVERYKAIRSFAASFAHLVNDLAPDGREKSTAVTKIEEAVMWANAAIARQECDLTHITDPAP